MQRARCLILLVAILTAIPASAGDIQVFCEPGLRVYLDGTFMGLSSERQDGLFLMDVAGGEHTVWVEKDGFLSQRFEIEILDQPIEVTVAEFEPVPEAPREETPPPAAEVTRLVGNLVVTSAPQNCIVAIDGKPQEKNSPQLLIGGLTEGTHVITFSRPDYETVTGFVMIEAGTEVRVRGNLIDGTVETLHEGKGSLRIISKPTNITVRFMDQIREKTSQKLNLSHIPAGEYPLRVQWRGLDLTTSIVIKNHQRTVVRVSFMQGDDSFMVSYEDE